MSNEDFEDDHFYQPYPVIRGSCVVMSHNDFSWSVENGVLRIQIRYIPNKPRFCEYTESLTLHPTDEEPTTCIAYLDEDEEDEDWDDDEQEED